MQYRVLRIGDNTDFWQHPSTGRRGKDGYGSYIKKTGFGGEDWNFNVEQALDGFIYGYTRAGVARKYLLDEFNIAFVTWNPIDRWRLVGFYLGARYFTDGKRVSPAVLEKRCDEILRLQRSGDLGSGYAGLPRVSLRKRVLKDLKSNHWMIRIEGVFICPEPVRIPPRVWNAKRQRFTVSNIVNARTFENILSLSKGAVGASDADGLGPSLDDEKDFREGRIKTRLHKYRERHPEIVRKAKTEFLRKHKRFFCQACKCEFVKDYGRDYIEAHHLVPVAELDGSGPSTRTSDLAMVCANCHRMLHRHRPWLKTIEDLPKVLLKNR